MEVLKCCTISSEEPRRRIVHWRCLSGKMCNILRLARFSCGRAKGLDGEGLIYHLHGESWHVWNVSLSHNHWNNVVCLFVYVNYIVNFLFEQLLCLSYADFFSVRCHRTAWLYFTWFILWVHILMQATYIEKTAMIHRLDANVRKCNEINDKIIVFYNSFANFWN